MLAAKTIPEKLIILATEILIAVMWGVVIVVGFWLWDREPPLENLNGRFVKWAEDDARVAVIEWRAIRKRSCQGWNYRNLISDQAVIPLHPWYIEERDVPPEDIDNVVMWRVEFELPHDFQKAHGSYRVRHEYYCNPLQRILRPITVTAPDVPLEFSLRFPPSRQE